MSLTEEEAATSARFELVAYMIVEARTFRRAELMARRDLALVATGVSDRLRQTADAVIAAVRRGDSKPLACESPRIPPDTLADYFRPVIEHFERELEEQREQR